MITEETYLEIRSVLIGDAKSSVWACLCWRGNNDFNNYGEGFCRHQMAKSLNAAAQLRRLIMRLDAEFLGGAR